MRPLVILHGLFGSSRNWQNISKRITVEIPGKPVYPIDLRNHNCKNNPKAIVGPVESWKTLQEDLEAFWSNNLNRREFDLLGHSFVHPIIIYTSNFYFVLGRSNCNEFSFN